MRPVVCMITPPDDATGDHALLRKISAAARSGVPLIHIRRPGLEALPLFRFVERAVQAIAGSRARVLVNERADVALAAGAHGVHLRSDSFPASRLRAMVPPGFIIGRSVHSCSEAVAAERTGGLDYLLFGTVFATGSKPGVRPAGIERLADACRAVTLPVLAIGGMTLSAMAPVGRSGAVGFAAIGLFADTDDDALPQVIQEANARFDTPVGVP